MQEIATIAATYGFPFLISLIFVIQTYRISEDFRTKYMKQYFDDIHILQEASARDGEDFKVVKTKLGSIEETVIAIHGKVFHSQNS